MTEDQNTVPLDIGAYTKVPLRYARVCGTLTRFSSHLEVSYI